MSIRMITATCVAAFALAGCAAGNVASRGGSPRPPDVMTPGMVMPDGSTMGAVAVDAVRPSAAAKMICSAEIHTSIKQILGLATTPHATATWADQTYTCTYALPQGRLRLSVKESASATAARTYAAELRDQLDNARAVDGLTAGAYGTSAGEIVLTKDNDTLLLDATGLPPIVGRQHAKRFDFAYELTSDILGCWTGDDGS